MIPDKPGQNRSGEAERARDAMSSRDAPGPADPEAQPELRFGSEAEPVGLSELPTMADLDALSAELDEIDETLAELNKRPQG